MPKNKKLRFQCFDLWKIAVFKKWGIICEVCNKRKAQTGHHFIKQADCESLRYDTDNGVPICAKCHPLIELRRPALIGKVVFKRGEGWYNSIMQKRKKVVPGMKTNKYYRETIERLTKEIN